MSLTTLKPMWVVYYYMSKATTTAADDAENDEIAGWYIVDHQDIEINNIIDDSTVREVFSYYGFPEIYQTRMKAAGAAMERAVREHPNADLKMVHENTLFKQFGPDTVIRSADDGILYCILGARYSEL